MHLLAEVKINIFMQSENAIATIPEENGSQLFVSIF
jgi:hypothetical protein